MNRPLLLDTEWVRPLSTDGDDIECQKCERLDAKWAVGKPPNGLVLCAHCFLYETPWGNDNRSRVTALAIEVEKATASTIVDSDGEILRSEADRILMSIVVISGVVTAKRAKNEVPGS